MGSGGSTVVENLPHHLELEGLNPTIGTDKGGEKLAKRGILTWPAEIIQW
jgi:hypothetical protein